MVAENLALCFQTTRLSDVRSASDYFFTVSFGSPSLYWNTCSQLIKRVSVTVLTALCHKSSSAMIFVVTESLMERIDFPSAMKTYSCTLSPQNDLVKRLLRLLKALGQQMKEGGQRRLPKCGLVNQKH